LLRPLLMESPARLKYTYHKDGHRISVSIRVSTLTGGDGHVIGGIELFTDISNRATNELRIKELEKLALLDNLTLLANRNYIEREIQIRFEEKRRYDMPFDILFKKRFISISVIVERSYTNMIKKSFPLSKVYGLLQPGPVVMVTTASRGCSNIMAMSWHTMMEFEPPLVGCVISNRNYSFGLLKATNECVINIPTMEIAEKVVGCGNTSGAKIDKFETFGLTPKPASQVGAPIIQECYANLECRVADKKMVTEYCLFVLEVVKAWIDPSVKTPRTLHHLGKGSFMVAGERIKLKSRMK
jgi:flavin reductase (DIM6/NTAB) family NADH-FMN oxidoreductase RutF